MKRSKHVIPLTRFRVWYRPLHLVTLALLLPLSIPAGAANYRSPWLPDKAFAQAGVGEGAQTMAFGVTWDWTWRDELLGGDVTGHWEASFGRWSAEQEGAGGRRAAWATQLGITPVLRWYPSAWRDRWFIEAGIGANVILPIYRTRDKRFSTAFNFGDHLAIGHRFGAGRQQELILRVQHFSNASIKRPNPGEDFLQLRYAHSF